MPGWAGEFLRTFLTERTGIRVNPDVVQKLEQHLSESSGVSSAQVQHARNELRLSTEIYSMI